MLVLALILVAVAIIVFAIDFMAVIGRSLVSLGLAFFAGGIAAWLIDILQAQGKL